MAKAKRPSTYLNRVSGQKENPFPGPSTLLNTTAANDNSPITGDKDYLPPFSNGPGQQRVPQQERSRAGGGGVFQTMTKAIEWIIENVGMPIADFISAGMPDDPERITQVQQELSRKGMYQGPIDGTKNEQFMQAMADLEQQAVG